MSKTGWKQVERDAADVLGAKRHWANAGERVDVDSPHWAAQVKNRRSLSLEELGMLVDEMTVAAIDAAKLPVVLVKQSCGRPTQLLAVVPASVLRALRVQFIEPALRENPDMVRALAGAYLKELPGMRERVGRYVAKSKARGRSR